MLTHALRNDSHAQGYHALPLDFQVVGPKRLFQTNYVFVQFLAGAIATDLNRK